VFVVDVLVDVVSHVAIIELFNTRLRRFAADEEALLRISGNGGTSRKFAKRPWGLVDE
jgi:hypothetical protein